METTDKTTWQRWLDLLTEEGYRPRREEVDTFFAKVREAARPRLLA
jgi:hypothetical protein